MQTRLVCVAVAITVNYAAVPAQRTVDHVVGQYRGDNIALPLPVDHPVLLSTTVHQIAASTHTPIGIELLPDPHAGVVRCQYKTGRQVVMSGKTVGEAFDRIVEICPEYQWRVGYAGAVNLLPRQAEPGASPWLLAHVPEFTLQNATLSDALAAVHRIIDPTFRGGGTTLSFGHTAIDGPDPAEVEAQRLEENKRITVGLRNGTVVDVLNAIVAAHGAATWQVKYRYTQAVYQNSEISLVGFSGRSIGFYGAPRRR